MINQAIEELKQTKFPDIVLKKVYTFYNELSFQNDIVNFSLSNPIINDILNADYSRICVDYDSGEIRFSHDVLDKEYLEKCLIRSFTLDILRQYAERHWFINFSNTKMNAWFKSQITTVEKMFDMIEFLFHINEHTSIYDMECNSKYTPNQQKKILLKLVNKSRSK